ncbi:hypothetical protein M404DRAFT_491122 [Pisolithus tinctorius Marx 270]|uniref:Uncharacterized protein n=1 Tax=Pisolithus tinctorius Marx 270 TaxID=870435 RepID=A0A0C3PDY5_PISTI|nr:hypothetical protein M404DRAFT_491122 [Pisolithus tinctorius Marx 270]
MTSCPLLIPMNAYRFVNRNMPISMHLFIMGPTIAACARVVIIECMYWVPSVIIFRWPLSTGVGLTTDEVCICTCLYLSYSVIYGHAGGMALFVPSHVRVLLHLCAFLGSITTAFQSRARVARNLGYVNEDVAEWNYGAVLPLGVE